ncbi:MAG: tRNA (adenosine(37)-N6)-dimethylallyltransferase MiaA [SAR202 cluster bacterium]|nr:tRNA (adenosine(37)-N6)-dimethylallyltransferase MiaA [SAR202 cluster bacterium]
MIRVVAVVGPTATGKTGLAVDIALAVGGEIVNADSRQFCRGFDIGTAKPTAADRRGVPHHLVDIVEAGGNVGLRDFIDRAQAAISSVHAGGRIPIVAGGTGQYVWSLLEGWTVARVPPDPEFRVLMEREAADKGHEAVFARLQALDPVAAQRIDGRNVRRVIRAIEVARELGPVAVRGPGRATVPPYEYLVIGLTLERKALYERIDRRIDAMVAAGWQAEVAGLLAQGVPADAPCFGAIGYPGMVAAARGEITLHDAVRRARHDTRRLVRHQYNWFKLSDSRISWLDAGQDPSTAAIALARAFLSR